MRRGAMAVGREGDVERLGMISIIEQRNYCRPKEADIILEIKIKGERLYRNPGNS